MIQTLMLRRAPGVVRTAEFQKELIEWHENGGITLVNAGCASWQDRPSSGNVAKQKPSLVERLEEVTPKQAVIGAAPLSNSFQALADEQVEAQIEDAAAPI